MQYVKVNTPNGAVVTKNNFGAWSVSNHDALDVSTYGVYGLDTETKQWITNGEDSVVRVPTETTVTASGAAKLNNCAEEPLQELRVYGKTTQDGTPTPDAPVPLVSVGDDGAVGVTVAGKNLVDMAAFDTMTTSGGHDTYDATTHTITMNSDFASGTAGRYTRLKDLLVGTTYTVSFDVRGTAGKRAACGWNNARTQIVLTSDFVRYSSTAVITRADEAVAFYSRITSDGGLAAGEFMQFANVQVEIGSTATAYEPYKPAQTLTLPTPNGLPSVGDVYDEIDLERGVYVQRVKKLVVDSVKEVYDNGGVWYAVIRPDAKGKSYSAISSTHFIGTTGALRPGNVVVITTGNIQLALTDQTIQTAGAWNAWIAAQTVPLEIVYALATPIEIPLSAEEIAAYKAIRTHRPTTTVYNDDGAQMEITYREDIDGVLENTFAALNLTDRHIPLLVYGESAQDHIIDTNDTGLVNTLLNALQGITAIGNRMIGYYPEVIKAILEFTAITRTEGYEIECLNNDVWGVLDDAYLLTMGEERIEQWERILGIVVQENSTVQDRRDVVVARIRGQGKLNTALINAIVNAFTGGTAVSWVEDSVLNVEITPPPNNKQFKFENVEHELSKKVPAHIGLKVMRSYAEWIDIKNNFATWNDVKSDLGTWTDVMFFVVRS